VQILLATDADWIVEEIVAALGRDGVTFTVVRNGRLVSEQVAEAPDDAPIDLVVADLQSGTMGGMAVTMALRLDESAGVVPHVPVLMLLDRPADIHLARRSGAEGWLIKPLNPLRLRRAADALLAGGSYTEGLPAPAPTVDEPADLADDGTTGEPAEEEPAPAG
jgi:DNA-binding response OmpR family regulator